MGKGKCSQSIEAARGTLGCLICLVLIGPVLFIVGIVYIVKPNYRDENISKFNSKATSWSTGADLKIMTDPTIKFTVDSKYTMMPAPSTVIPKGNTAGVLKNATSYPYVYMDTSNQPTHLISISYKGVDSNNAIASAASTTTTSMLTCSSSTYHYSSSSQTCRNVGVIDCPSTYNDGYSGASSCNRGQVCGTCYRYRYLSILCMQISTVAGVTMSTRKGCRYPFSSYGVYSTSNTPIVTVQVFHENDPYIWLQQITEGDEDFGLTADEEIKLGIILLAIGGIITAGLLFMAFLICCHDGSRQRWNNVYSTGRGQPQPQVIVVGQPVQQEMQQPGPQPGYGQPGAPQPGYGQPPQ
eukprot:PhF_6_TR13303/c0_g1_i1/m.21079